MCLAMIKYRTGNCRGLLPQNQDDMSLQQHPLIGYMVRLKLTPFWVGNNLQSHLPHTQFCGEADLSQYRFILYSVLDIGYCESHLMIRAGEGGRNDVQGSAKRRGLGCVNSLPGCSLANSHAFLPISVKLVPIVKRNALTQRSTIYA